LVVLNESFVKLISTNHIDRLRRLNFKVQNHFVVNPRIMTTKTDILICGAGIAGVSTAYQLAVKHGIKDILLVDERPPLTLTSDVSTEGYRNWWPGPGNGMIALMNRSIDIMEGLARENGTRFNINRRGYLYVAGNPISIPFLQAAAQETSHLGGGPLRVYTGSQDDPVYVRAPAEGFENLPVGADLFLDSRLIHRQFPYLTERTAAVLHVRRAGWFSAQQLGMFFLEKAREKGVHLQRGRVVSVDIQRGKVQAVTLDDGSRIDTSVFVNAAGPMLKPVGCMLGVDLPVFSELHLKVVFKDPLGILPRHAPLIIWTDPQTLSWSKDEEELLKEEGAELLLKELPPGAHTRPEGGADSQSLLMLWEYHNPPVEPIWPLPIDPYYPDIVLRGLVAMLPGMQVYLGRASRPEVDGGYYTKTRRNRPIIGPMPVDGAYCIGALSGFGLMSACAASELIAAMITGKDLPDYAPEFLLENHLRNLNEPLPHAAGAFDQL
jgi:glycine/D-amino acid oxidase-like deaminating enzyme